LPFEWYQYIGRGRPLPPEILPPSDLPSPVKGILWEMFVKRFSLSCRTVVCLSCPVLSICNVGELWPNGWMDQDAIWYGGRPHPRPHCVRWRPSFFSLKKEHSSPQFSAHVYCGQMAGWIKMKLGLEVGLDPGHIVLDRDPAPFPKRDTVPQLLAHVCCGQMAG